MPTELTKVQHGYQFDLTAKASFVVGHEKFNNWLSKFQQDTTFFQITVQKDARTMFKQKRNRKEKDAGRMNMKGGYKQNFLFMIKNACFFFLF